MLFRSLYTDAGGNLRLWLPSTQGLAFTAAVTMASGETYYFVFGIGDDGTVTPYDFLAVNGTIVTNDADKNGWGWSFVKSTGIITLTADAEVQGRSTNGSFRIVVSESGALSALRLKKLTLATADAKTTKREK